MVMPKSPVGCPLDSLLRLLMGPWTTYILWVLTSNGPTRFGELKRRVPGISAKVLTERLRMLQEAEVIYRDFQPTIPPQVTYSLTERGKELHGVLESLSGIAQRWKAADAARANGAAGGDQPLAAAEAGNGYCHDDAGASHEPAPAVATPSALG
ncbi:MAG TPA: helix-turn-helix domain-containing protein [Dongiaceae bacterium]|jgi:DNA-binding HxlR family transcriptional regulator